jgi:hypothetical protein
MSRRKVLGALRRFFMGCAPYLVFILEQFLLHLALRSGEWQKTN